MKKQTFDIMNDFKIGNIIKFNKSLVIITDVREDMIHWISFDCENSSGVTKRKTTTNQVMCWSCNTNDGEETDFDCIDCKGTGYYNKEVIGMDNAAIFIAPNVKQYIIDNLLKNFDWF